MRLSDRDLKQAILAKEIVISPFRDLDAIQGVCIDLHLGFSFRSFEGHKVPFIDLAAPSVELERTLQNVMKNEQIVQEGERFILHPGELVLAVTHEHVEVPNHLVGWLDGRSSLARLGLMVHVTSHRIDPGWKGQIVLECYNSGKLPLALAPLMRICAINFEKLSSTVEYPYTLRKDAKYKYQLGAVASKINADLLEI